MGILSILGILSKWYSGDTHGCSAHLALEREVRVRVGRVVGLEGGLVELVVLLLAHLVRVRVRVRVRVKG